MVPPVTGETLPKFEVFNVGSGVATSIAELFRLVTHHCQNDDDRIPFHANFDPTKPTGRTCIVLDCNKALDVLVWIPKVPLVKGIRKTYEWLKCKLGDLEELP